jgi:hypothetical protein
LRFRPSLTTARRFGNLSRIDDVTKSAPMKPRGTRVACSLRTSDGANGVYSVFPGESPRSIASVEPVKWDREPSGEVVQGAFTVIGEMGMTGQIVLVDAEKWRALRKTGLEQHFYAAILWGGTPLKVADDALVMARRA